MPESIGMVGQTGPVMVPCRYAWQVYPSGQPRFIYWMDAEALLWPEVPVVDRAAANDS